MQSSIPRPVRAELERVKRKHEIDVTKYLEWLNTLYAAKRVDTK